MYAQILDDMTMNLDEAFLMELLRVDEDDAEAFRALLDKARAVGKPKAMLREFAIDRVDEDGIVVEGKCMGGPMVAKQMTGASRAVAYVITCGQELHDLARAQADPLEEWWADNIAEAALRGAGEKVFAEMNGIIGEGATVNPGSTQGWTVMGQFDLFSILGDVEGSVGVRLGDTGLMIPFKSVSGIYFASSDGYTNCRFCTIKNCPNRREPFNPMGAHDG